MQSDIVEGFLERNSLEMIIRAHECVMDGFERFAGGKLITVFSAPNYCGMFVLFIKLSNFYGIWVGIYACE